MRILVSKMYALSCRSLSLSTPFLSFGGCLHNHGPDLYLCPPFLPSPWPTRTLAFDICTSIFSSTVMAHVTRVPRFIPLPFFRYHARFSFALIDNTPDVHSMSKPDR